MSATPEQYYAAALGDYQRQPLERYRWHTGAPILPLAPDERCPILFRDLGADGTARFLDGALCRLAGPLSPIVYLRSAEYREPYHDHARIGRLVVIAPLALRPFKVGRGPIYVAAGSAIAPHALGWVPGEMALPEAARRLEGVRELGALSEALGGRLYLEARAEARRTLAALAEELARAERRAEPLRAALRSRSEEARAHARAEMERLGISETQLCAAWHHLPAVERRALIEALEARLVT